jgi:hypothetical protein
MEPTTPTTYQLRRELDEKRNELTRDVERLEAKVKSTLDLAHQIQERPLLSVGLAVLGGFVIGRLGGGGDKPTSEWRHQSALNVRPYSYGGYGAMSASASPPQASAESRPHDPGLIDHVKDGLQESFRRGTQGSTVDGVLTNMTAALTAIMVSKAKELLDQNLPGFADQYDRVARPTGAMHHQAHEPMSAGRGEGVSSPYQQPASATAAAGSSPVGSSRHD